MIVMDNFSALLEESVRVHGHLCAGQVLGVRMSMLGLDLIDINDPKGVQRKDFLVYVEMDRCATDAVQSVTGCSLGKRSMKFMDFGKMAATFVNLKSSQSIRIYAKEDSRERAKTYFPDTENKYKAQLEAYKIMSSKELFTAQAVTLNIPEEDMPGRPISRVICESCGEHVQDRREDISTGSTLCRACATGGYYSVIKDVYL